MATDTSWHTVVSTALGELTLVGQVVQGREQLAVGQVAGGAEDDERVDSVVCHCPLLTVVVTTPDHGPGWGRAILAG